MKREELLDILTCFFYEVHRDYVAGKTSYDAAESLMRYLDTWNLQVVKK